MPRCEIGSSDDLFEFRQGGFRIAESLEYQAVTEPSFGTGVIARVLPRSTSCGICQYLESQYPEPVLMGRNALEQAIISMWNTKIEQNGIAALAETLRNHAKGMQDRALPGPLNLAQIPELVERGRTRAAAFFDRLDDQLTDNAFVTGDQFTMADITAYVMVQFAGWSKLHIQESQKNLQRWNDTISKRPDMQA